MNTFNNNEIENLNDITFIKIKSLGIAISDANIIINGIYAHYVPNDSNLKSCLNENQCKIHSILYNVLKNVKDNEKRMIKMKRYFVAFMNECDECESNCLKNLATIGNDLNNFLKDLGIDKVSQRAEIVRELRKEFGT